MIEDAGRRVRAVLKTASRGDRRGRAELRRIWRLADVLGLESVSLKDRGRGVSPPAPRDKGEGAPR